MKIFVKDDQIVATHNDDQDVESLYEYDFIYNTNNNVFIDYMKKFSEQFDYQVDNLDIYKSNKKTEIKNAFIKAFQQGVDISIGLKVDCRRDKDNNDLQNFESLLKYMERTDKKVTQIKLWDNSISRLISKKELGIIIDEIIEHVINLYNKKWYFENIIENTTSIEELKSIKWV